MEILEIILRWWKRYNYRWATFAKKLWSKREKESETFSVLNWMLLPQTVNTISEIVLIEEMTEKLLLLKWYLLYFRSLPCQSMLCLNHKNSRTGQLRKSAEISKRRKIKSKSFWNFPSYLIKCKKYCNIEKICSQFIYIQGLFSQQWNSSKNRNWQNGRSIWHFWPKSQSTFQRLETPENSRQILQRWLAPEKWVSFCQVRFKKSIKV